MKNFRQCLFAFALLAFFSCSKDDCEKKAWKDDCFCTMDYNPVCGCDGETYSNACHAECHGIKQYTPGECK